MSDKSATKKKGLVGRKLSGAVSKAKHLVNFTRRYATAGSRVLPHFVIIGTMKGGTSTLYYRLGHHPQVHVSSTKEVHFFDVAHHRGERWYRAHFPRRAEVKPDQRVGEATPYYVYHPLVPQRVQAVLPTARFIVLLRNPVKRAISHYYHQVKRGRETLNLAKALDAEAERLAGANDIVLAGKTSRAHQHFSYVDRGIYLPQLERWWKLFGREQLLVLRSEDFFKDPLPVLKQVCEHIGVDPTFSFPDMAPRNVGGYREDPSPEVIERLTAFYRPHNQRLAAALGRDMGWD